MLVYIFRASFVKLNFFDWTVMCRGLWEKLRREVREEKQKMEMEKRKKGGRVGGGGGGRGRGKEGEMQADLCYALDPAESV